MSLRHLDGDKVLLKALDQNYLEIYWELIKNSDSETIVFTGSQMAFSKSQVAKYLENIPFDHSRADFLIIDKETDQAVGEVVLNDISRNNRNANIRVAIFSKEDFGKGLGTEAIILALNYGFGMLNLHRIDLTVLGHNKRAIHVYEKIGFKKEGVLRDYWYFNHQYHDMITMSILDDEFIRLYMNEEQ